MLQPAWNKHFAGFCNNRQNHAIKTPALKAFTVVHFSGCCLKCLPALGLRETGELDTRCPGLHLLSTITV